MAPRKDDCRSARVQFIRIDRHHRLNAQRLVTFNETDRTHMRRALSLAQRGWGHTAPNPMVGAVIVGDDGVVGEGWHARHGDAHAEIMALRDAADRARGATLYVTLEPCDHQGKTPPCTRDVIAAGITRVVAATSDPNPAARGGAVRLREAGITVDVGVERDAALELNAPFFNAYASDRPWVTLKLAMSLDGAIADRSRRRGWLTGEAARREVHRLRAGSDAIAVGAGTATADDPMLTVRDADPPRVAPTRVVFDGRATLSPDSALVRSARDVPTVVVACEPEPDAVRGLEGLGVEVLRAPDEADALRQLFRRGVRSILVEGGAGLTARLMGQSLVDRLIIFQAPVVLGAGALHAFSKVPDQSVDQASRFRVLERRELDQDLMTIYALNQIPEVR
jgi:diaminohydroxyphosphoribosylaminopyrimidine deaminase / 5-amino-6-(5-phosphoribosylamino)uracil reductase